MLCTLSSGQGCPSKKHIFGHVTSLIGENVIAAYSEKFPRAAAYTCQESALWLQSYCQKKMQIHQLQRIRRSHFNRIQITGCLITTQKFAVSL